MVSNNPANPTAGEPEFFQDRPPTNGRKLNNCSSETKDCIFDHVLFSRFILPTLYSYLLDQDEYALVAPQEGNIEFICIDF